MRLRVQCLSLVASLFVLSGCPGPMVNDAGQHPLDGGGTGEDAGVVDAGPPPEPELHFFVNRRPHDPASDWEETAGPERYSDPLRFVASDLEVGSEVVLRTISNLSTSKATFVVGEDGRIDTARDAPASGDWSGVDVDGPLWSLQPPRTPPDGFELGIDVAVIDDDDELIVDASVERRFVDEDVFTQSVAEGEIIGTLALPEGPGPHPAVLVFGGSEGGDFYGGFMAPYLAQLGFAAFGVAYFGTAGVSSSLNEVPLERLEADLAYLADQPEVDGERLAVMGASRGGELALLLGAYLSQVSAVVAEVPSGYVWGSYPEPGDAAWTWEGTALPRVPFSPNATFEIEYDDDNIPHYSGRQSFFTSIDEASPAALEAAAIAIENVQGPVWMNGGADDHIWPSCDLAEVAWNRLEDAGHTSQWADSFTCYPDAGHSITVPGSSMMLSTEFFNPAFQGYLRRGGTPAGNAAASRASNTALRAFLETSLQP